MLYETTLLTWGIFSGVLMQYYYTSFIKEPNQTTFQFKIYLVDKPKKQLSNKELQVDLDNISLEEEVLLVKNIPKAPLHKNWYNIFE